MKELPLILQHLAELREPAALATLVKIEGSSYRRAGARQLLLPNDARIGAISGGCLEEDLAERARAVFADGRPVVLVYDTTAENDAVWGTGLGCHGIVHILLEKLTKRPAWAVAVAENFARRRPTELAVVWQAADPAWFGTHLAEALPSQLDRSVGVFRETAPPPPALIVCGAGDDAQPLVRFASELSWQVTVIDPRPAYATAARFPGASRVIAAEPQQLSMHVHCDAHTLAVVMTHAYRHDIAFLRALHPQPLAYLGLLGPKKRAEKLLADLSGEGIVATSAQQARLHAPVGLDIGGETPETVALSILAEMQASLAGRDGRPLRERRGSIHA